MPNPIAEYADGTRKQWNGQAWVSLEPAAHGFDATANSQKYMDKLSTARATSDMARLDAGAKAEQEAYGNAATADRAREVLADDTPTGAFSGARITAGRAMGGKLSHALSLGFIPTKEQTANLETVQNLGNVGALGQVGQLKGPLSDRDVLFLKTLQYNPDASRAQNQRVVEAQTWVAKRQAAYAAAQRKWTENLGSPSALNKDGKSFDRWWGGYSAMALPPPGLTPKAAGAPAKVAAPAGVDPKVWSHMTPQEQALWR